MYRYMYNAVILKTGARGLESSCASPHLKGVLYCVQHDANSGEASAARSFQNFRTTASTVVLRASAQHTTFTRLLIHACFRCNSSGDPARSAPNAAPLPSLGSRKHTIRDDHWHREIPKLLGHPHQASSYWLRRASD